MIPTLEELDAYIKLLKHHDWYFDYSDDGNVWRRGNEQQKVITDTAKKHELYDQAYKIWSAYIFRDTSISGIQAEAKRNWDIAELRSKAS